MVFDTAQGPIQVLWYFVDGGPVLPFLTPWCARQWWPQDVGPLPELGEASRRGKWYDGSRPAGQGLDGKLEGTRAQWGGEAPLDPGAGVDGPAALPKAVREKYGPLPWTYFWWLTFQSSDRLVFSGTDTVPIPVTPSRWLVPAADVSATFGFFTFPTVPIVGIVLEWHFPAAPVLVVSLGDGTESRLEPEVYDPTDPGLTAIFDLSGMYPLPAPVEATVYVWVCNRIPRGL